MTGDQLLRAAADRDGAAVRTLRHTTAELLDWRSSPLHIGAVVTDLLSGASPGLERDLDDDWITVLGHQQQLTRTPPPGVPIRIDTPTGLGSVYGQLVGTHLDPPEELLAADGTVPDQPAGHRRRCVVDLHAAPHGLGLTEETLAAFARACRQQRWFTPDGHLHVTTDDDGQDDTARYARWLTHPDRAGLRGRLPDSPDRTQLLLTEIAELLASYRATFVHTHGWLWTTDALTRHLDRAVGAGRLRHELDVVARRAVAVYHDPATRQPQPARRALACELALTAAGWDASDRQQLTHGTAWLSTLFALTATITRRLPDAGPPLLPLDDGTYIETTDEPRYGIAGIWRCRPVTDTEVEHLRQQARDLLDEETTTRADHEIAATTFPFTHTLTRQQFRTARLHLPDDALARLQPDAPVTVRLAYTPTGRHAHRPVRTATTSTTAHHTIAFDWPALLPADTRLEGTVSRRGRLVELWPTHS